MPDTFPAGLPFSLEYLSFQSTFLVRVLLFSLGFFYIEQDTYVLVAMTTADVSEDRPLKKRRLDMSSSVNFRTGW